MDEKTRVILKALKCAEPASAEAIEVFCRVCGFSVPRDYVEFLQSANGATGTVGTDQYINLWAVEKLINKNVEYQVSRCAPDIFIFGSNGGGEAYGFDTRSVIQVVRVPFIPMSLEYAETVAPSFAEFLTALESGFL